LWRRWWRGFRLCILGRRSCIQIQTLAEAESQSGFSRIRNVAIVSCGSRADGSCTSANKSANQGSLATTSKTAN
jgi:hypothetical protein